MPCACPGADALLQAGRVAEIPGHLSPILGTAHSAAADRRDPARWKATGLPTDQGSRQWTGSQELSAAGTGGPVLPVTAAHQCRALQGNAASIWKHLLSLSFHPMPCSMGYEALPPQTHLLVVLQHEKPLNPWANCI